MPGQHAGTRSVAVIALTALLLGACHRRTDVSLRVSRPDATRPLNDNTASEAEPVSAPAAQPRRLVYRDTALTLALPPVAREFRGVWVATVANMDWPSRRSLTTQAAQQELLRILDTAMALKLNAVVLQVRPMGDAFYASQLEPWSDYLTGTSGKAPEPFWDPLQFAIEQAHARGLELHAWFNPFRAGFVDKQTPLAASHISRRRPDLVVRYGTHYWMDPGEPDVREHALHVMRDVVRRYDVDAVHIDDYFYPYREYDAKGKLIAFPDDRSWTRYGAKSGLERNDWRRENVNAFVAQLYETVKQTKRHVRVGISPFGIWRPGYPASVRGLDSYHELFADSRKWLTNGWVDYYAPQLYWRTYAPQQDYSQLLQWWTEQNPYGRHIWAGNMPNSINGGARGWPSSEIAEQVQLTRANPHASGNVFFSISSLQRNADGVAELLGNDVYAEPALVPASPWLSAGRAARPHVVATPDEGFHATSLRLDAQGDRPASWIVRARYGAEWRTLLLPGVTSETFVDWNHGQAPDVIAVTPVDRAGVEGESAVLVLVIATNNND